MTNKHDQIDHGASDSQSTSQFQVTRRRTAAGNWLTLVLVAVVSASAGSLLRFPVADAAQQKEAETPSEGYAMAYLQLAEAQLEYAEEMNRRVKGTFTQPQIREFRESVQISKDLVKQEEKTGHFNRMQAMVRWAQHRQLSAETDVDLAEALNKRVPDSVSDERIKELKAYETLMRIDMETGEAAINASPEEQLQWRITVLEDQLLRLSQRVNLLRQLEQ